MLNIGNITWLEDLLCDSAKEPTKKMAKATTNRKRNILTQLFSRKNSEQISQYEVKRVKFSFLNFRTRKFEMEYLLCTVFASLSTVKTKLIWVCNATAELKNEIRRMENKGCIIFTFLKT